MYGTFFVQVVEMGHGVSNWGGAWRVISKQNLLSEDVSSREDASTSWPSISGLRGRARRRTFYQL
jgi:hypothetical protein